MKKTMCCLLAVLLTLFAGGCSIDTYTQNSDSDEFELANVTSVTLAGPNNTDASGTLVTLTPAANPTELATLQECIQGEKIGTCPTGSFGIGKLTFTFTSGDQTTVYPANDGSNWFCLYSLNPSIASYIQVEASQMKQVVALMKRHGIDVIM